MTIKSSLLGSNVTSLDTTSEDELQELNRRAEEMENNPSICIPHEKVYEMVMARIRQ